MKILVVYYSRSGNTKKLAEDIAKNLKADTEEIVDLRPRKGVLGFFKSGRDSLLRRETEIKKSIKDPSKYDLVLVGTPVWAGNITPAARTYVRCNKDKFGKVACFCTMGGNSPRKAFDEIKKIIGKTPLATLHARSKLINKNIHKDILGDFINKIKSQTKEK